MIGTSGWSYRHWRDTIYPPRLPSTRWLTFFEERFDTVEVNSSFYRLPKPEVVENWSTLAPPGFEFALKMWRGITHYNKLKNAEANLSRFLDVADRLHPSRRGPLLIQLPPNQGVDLSKLETFLDQFAALAPSPWRLALEFRHDSWLIPQTYSVLDKRNVALCVHDMRGKGAVEEPNEQAGFVYVRRHGSGDTRYSGSYTPEELRRDAHRIERWRSAGRRVYVYYNNDIGGHAFHNALSLRMLCEAHL